MTHPGIGLRGAFFAVGLLVGLSGPLGSAAEAGCRAKAEISPTEAVVGEQLLYRARIERSADVDRVDWLRAPVFPDFLSEWLPGLPERAVMHEDGSTWLVREERRAIFPSRAGELEIPGAAIVCMPREQLELAPVRVKVARPPVEGRPAHYAGLVGPIQMQLRVDSPEVRLGETVRATVSIRGAANVWDQPNPFDPRSLGPPSPPTELFEAGSDLDLDRGDRLSARIFHRFELVPRAAGALRIPPLRVSYYDPSSGRYQDATSPPAEVRVLPDAPRARADGERAPAAGKREGGPGPAPPGSGLGGPPLLVPGLLLVALLCAGAGWPLYVKQRERSRALRDALREARAAAARGDWRAEAGALESALRAALRARSPELGDLPAAELVGRPGNDEHARRVGEALTALERVRFDASEVPPDRDAVLAVLRGDLT